MTLRQRSSVVSVDVDALNQLGSVTCLMDIGPAVHQRAGLSRYSERLAAFLSTDLGSEINLAAFYNSHSGHQRPRSLQELPAYTVNTGQYRWRLSALMSQVTHRPYQPIESAIDALAASHHKPIVYHATEHLLPRLSTPAVLTIHDLIFEHLPQHHTRANRLFLRLSMPLFIRNATHIIAVSNQTRNDIVAHYAAPESKISVIYEGVDARFTQASPRDQVRIRRQYSDDAPYLLMVGSIEPRKNHIAAMQAMELLKREGYPHRLLIAGGPGWMYEPIMEYAQRSSANDRISFLDFVPQEDLPVLYSAAVIFLQPSYYEGFGFTALEAMACGAPVLCSSAGSLPEVVGNAAIQVAPDDIAGLAQWIRNIIDQPRLRQEMSRLGQINASRFRWQDCARQTANVYRAVARRRNTAGRFS